MDITSENFEEWCFRYLEKDLDEEECLFFEKELQSNSALKKESGLWEKTKLTDCSLVLKPHLNTNLYRFNKQFLFVLLEFSVVAIAVLSICFAIATKQPASKIEFGIEIKTEEEENKSAALQDTFHKKNIYPLRNIGINSSESRTTHAEHLVIDSTLIVESIQNKPDSILPSAKQILLDTTVFPKDSIEIKVKNKSKTKKRENYNDSKLIPINNDL